MNEKKVSFICCVNHPVCAQECFSYLSDLYVPEGYQAEWLPVYGAESMAAGYNQAMRQSDAKYKVYLHQDVYIWNRNFIFDLLRVFDSDQNIGMAGVFGATDTRGQTALAGIWDAGLTYACTTEDAFVAGGARPAPGTVMEVAAVDGMLMATQYDIPWEENVSHPWEGYDARQCMEFQKRGYSVVIPYQETPWCMHDNDRKKLNDREREDCEAFVREVSCRMACGEVSEALTFCEREKDHVVCNSRISFLNQMASVCSLEQKFYGSPQSWKAGETVEAAQERYLTLKFLLWDAERSRNDGRERLTQALLAKQFSIPLVVTAGVHSLYYFEEMLPMLSETARRDGNEKELRYVEQTADWFYFRRYEKLSGEDEEFKTFEEVSEVEQKCRRDAVIYERELPGHRKAIDRYLREKDRKKLLELLLSESFQDQFGAVTDMAYMILAAKIYEREVADGASWTVLDGRGSIQEIMAFIQEMKFLLWRMEFGMAGAKELLLACVRDNRVSGCLLACLVRVAGMHKLTLLERLAELFLAQDMVAMAFYMLRYADELQPGSEEILCSMADIYLKAGKKEEALCCLDQVKWPTRITAAFRKVCEA